MLKLLERICYILDALQIPYMLSGSVAMNLYADPRMTQDIDIVVEIDEFKPDCLPINSDDKKCERHNNYRLFVLLEKTGFLFRHK